MQEKRLRFSQVVLAMFLIFQISIPVGVQYLASSRSFPNPTHREIRPRVAVVKPVFTATAYSSFYSFYAKYVSTPKDQIITSDLGLLNTTLVDSWGWSDGLRQFLSSSDARANGLVLGNNLAVLSDVSVSEGGLFYEDGARRFDVVILGFRIRDFSTIFSVQALRCRRWSSHLHGRDEFPGRGAILLTDESFGSRKGTWLGV